MPLHTKRVCESIYFVKKTVFLGDNMSMKTRPWPIVILALCHILAPLPNIMLSAHLQGVGLWQYLQTFPSPAELVLYMAFFPVAGVAIFCTKKWSFPVFLSAMAWGFFITYRSWAMVPDQFPIALLFGAFAVNLAAVGYFLIPEVKRVYFDSTVRWWEQLPRYYVVFGAELFPLTGNTSVKCTILDISEGGAFVRVASKSNFTEKVRIQFEAFGMDIELVGRIAHCGVGEKQGYGIQFEDMGRERKRMVKKLIKALRLLGSECNKRGNSIPTDFAAWTKGLMSGKGLIPEYHDSKDKKKRPENKAASK